MSKRGWDLRNLRVPHFRGKTGHSGMCVTFVEDASDFIIQCDVA